MSWHLARILRFTDKALLCTLLLTLILASTATVVFSACTGCGTVDVSPGKSDQKLGAGFPTFGPVKLSYPNSSILTNSVGDLLFSVTLNKTSKNVIKGVPNAAFYGSIDIYVPPDFSGLSIGKVWTSFTNNYDPNSLSLSKLSSTDQIAPSWWRVSVRNLILTSDYTLLHSNSSLTSLRVFAANRTQYFRIFQVTSPSIAGRYFFKTFINGTSTGASKFPTVVVKASRDPAYISGTLLDIGNVDPTMAGKPINLTTGYGGKIVVTGRDYLGNPAAAQAFINSTAQGQYTLFGVAPGTYNVTAYAAGYLPTTLPTHLSVLPGQSLEDVDILMPHSTNLTLSVLSMTANGVQIPWGTLSGLFPNGTVFSRSRSISFQIISIDGTTTIDTTSKFVNKFDTRFNIAFTPLLDLDGRIPQDFANDTSGLSAGDYYLRAYVLSYVQLDDVLIHITNETTDIHSEIRLLRSNFLSLTIHFKDNNSTLAEVPLAVNGTLSVQLYDQQGIIRGQNTTFVYAGNRSTTLEVVGLSRSRTFGSANQFSHDYGLLPGTYYVLATLKSSPLFSGYANVGVRDLYYQLQDVQVTLGLASSATFNIPTQISFSLIRGGGLELALYSIDTQNPAVQRPFSYFGKTIILNLIDSYGNVYYANTTQPYNNVTRRLFYSGLLTNDYTIIVRTLGYTQRDVIKVHVVLGGNSDIAVWLVQDPVIDLTVFFKTEGILTSTNTTEPFAQPINNLDGTPVRLEVFDGLGNFVAATETYIPNQPKSGPANVANFTLAGFDQYFGDPRFIWAGFYDTTDAVSQTPGGLIPYPWKDGASLEYSVRIWVDGYYQLQPLHVIVPVRGNVSVVASVDRASRISGTVVGPDFFDTARPLSWAVIGLEPDNSTASGALDVRPGNYTTSSLDGMFQLWLPQGRYGMGVSLGGYSTYSAQVVVPSGSDMSMEIWLDNYQLSLLVILFEPLSTVALAMIAFSGSIFNQGDYRFLRHRFPGAQ